MGCPHPPVALHCTNWVGMLLDQVLMVTLLTTTNISARVCVGLGADAAMAKPMVTFEITMVLHEVHQYPCDLGTLVHLPMSRRVILTQWCLWLNHSGGYTR